MMKKFISILLVLVMVFCSAVSLAETNTDEEKEITITEEEEIDVSNVPEIPEGKLVAQMLETERGKQFAVMSAPNSRSIRGANGKAVVSTNGWIQVFGREGKWLMVQYAVNDKEHSDHYRIGYIRDAALPKDAEMNELKFDPVDGYINCKTSVTDDPLGLQGELTKLKEGTQVSALAEMGKWTYIEAKSSGKRFRGFVPRENVTCTRVVTSLSEARAAMVGSWSLFSGDTLCAEIFDFHEDGTVTGKNNVTTRIVPDIWNGNWSLNDYDLTLNRYWNEPEFELTIIHDGDIEHYGLKFFWQPYGDSDSEYALVLSDATASNDFVFEE